MNTKKIRRTGHYHGDACPQQSHPYAGVNTDRQGVGDPGHCENCAHLGHVAAHPDMGCGDVGCESGHDA